MAIGMDPGNVIQFFTFLSPILISSFFVLQSFMNADIKAMVWLVGQILAWGIGMATKFAFHAIDNGKVQGFIDRNQAVPEGTRYFQRRPIRMNWPMNAGQTANNVPDYCSVFSGPFGNSAVSSTSMPSLNAVFHSFTIAYILLAVANNPNHPPSGIVFLIVLGIVAIINWLYRINLYCDYWIDIAAGVLVGGGAGVGWYYAINAVNPTWTYYGREKKGKCVLGKQKFRCTYNTPK
jgi:hypothetical protein